MIAERKNTVAPRAQSVGVDPLSSTDIPSRSPLLAAGAGDPANLPAAAASQGGGLCDVQRPFHGERYDNLA